MSPQQAFLGLFRDRDVMMEKRSSATLPVWKMEEESMSGRSGREYGWPLKTGKGKKPSSDTEQKEISRLEEMVWKSYVKKANYMTYKVIKITD